MTDENTNSASTAKPAREHTDSTAGSLHHQSTNPTAATIPTPPVATAPRPSATPALHKRRPLFPTILWGALLLALAAFIAARELVPGGFDLVTWLLTAIVGIGLLLVVAGIIAASRRAG